MTTLILALNFLTLIMSISAFLFSLYQFFDTRKRNRSEATIHAFDVLEELVFNTEEYKNISIDRAIHEHDIHRNQQFPTSQRGERTWHRVTGYLALIEHFAVGVNSKVYDIKILRRMGRSYLTKQWEKLLPVIEKKRSEKNSNEIYCEFENMIKELNK